MTQAPRHFQIIFIFVIALGLVHRLSGQILQPWGTYLSAYLFTMIPLGVYFLKFYRLKFLTPWMLFGYLFTQFIPIYYFTTDSAFYNLGLPDRTLTIMTIEKAVFGGHFSLWLDQHPTWGLGTLFGKWLSEIAIIFYFLYFLWSTFIYFWLCSRMSREPTNKKLQNQFFVYLSTWSLNVGITYLFYLLVPTVGPEITLKQHYNDVIQGLWVTPGIHAFIEDHHLSIHDCFPSGHTALSWMNAYFGYRFVHRYVGWFLTVAAIFVTIATVYLRYHYIVDLIAAIPLITLLIVFARREKNA